MFPGADAPTDDAAYTILGAPLDVSATFRPGARFGPDRVRAMARGFEDYDRRTDAQFSDLAVSDRGDIRPWPDAAAYLEYLEGEIQSLPEPSSPILIGGEHTVTLAAVRAKEPEIFVSLDAHLDLRESFDGDVNSHATVTHQALAVADRAVLLGARAGSAAEWERAAAEDVEVVPPGEVHGWSPAAAGLRDPDTRVYCSLDLDVADPAAAPGTGTPEPGGLSAREVRTLVREIAPTTVGFDVTEITDRDDGQTALLAAKALRDWIYAHAAGD